MRENKKREKERERERERREMVSVLADAFDGVKGGGSRWRASVACATQWVEGAAERVERGGELEDGEREAVTGHLLNGLVRHLFLRSAANLERRDQVRVFALIQAVVRLGKTLLEKSKLDLLELDRTMTMVLGGPVHPPRNTADAKDEPEAAPDGPKMADVSVISMANAVLTLVQFPSFYQLHGLPKDTPPWKLEKQGTKVWPHQQDALLAEMMSKVGQTIVLTRKKPSGGVDDRVEKRVRIVSCRVSDGCFLCMEQEREEQALTGGKIQKGGDDKVAEWITLSDWDEQLIGSPDCPDNVLTNTTRDIGLRVQGLPPFSLSCAAVNSDCSENGDDKVLLSSSSSKEGEGKGKGKGEGPLSGVIIGWSLERQHEILLDLGTTGDEESERAIYLRNLSTTERVTASRLYAHTPLLKTSAEFPHAKDSKSLSEFQIETVSAFVSCGGFAAVIERINMDSSPMPLAAIVMYMRTLLCVQKCLTHADGGKAKWLSLAHSMFNAGVQRLEMLSDEELRFIQSSPRTLQSFVNVLCQLSPEYAVHEGMEQQSLNVLCEQLMLHVMAQFIQVSSIECRMFGLRNILACVKVHSTAEQRAAIAALSGTTQIPPKQALCAFSKVGLSWFKEWLDKINIVAILYENKNMRSELVKQSSGVILFMSQHGILDESAHLERVWRSSFGHERGTLRIIHSLLISLMDQISQYQRLFFFKEYVAALPFAMYDDNGDTLAFIYELTTRCLKIDSTSSDNMLQTASLGGHAGLGGGGGGAAATDSGGNRKRSTSPPLSVYQRARQKVIRSSPTSDGSSSEHGVRARRASNQDVDYHHDDNDDDDDDDDDDGDGEDDDRASTIDGKEEEERTGDDDASSSPRENGSARLAALAAVQTTAPQPSSEVHDNDLDSFTTGLPIKRTSSFERRRSGSLPNPQQIVEFSGNDYWYGLMLFWDFVQDANTCDTTMEAATLLWLKRLAIDLFVKILTGDNCGDDQRSSIIHACISNVKLGDSVPQSLEILRALICDAPSSQSGYWFPLSVSESRKHRRRRDHVIEKLDRQHKFVALLCDDLRRYLEHVRQLFYGAPGATASSFHVNDLRLASGVDHLLPFGSCYNHILQLSVRYDFFLFILTESDLCIKKAVAKQLWSAMVEQALSQKSQDLGLSWFGKAQARSVVHGDPTKLAAASSASGGIKAEVGKGSASASGGSSSSSSSSSSSGSNAKSSGVTGGEGVKSRTLAEKKTPLSGNTGKEGAKHDENLTRLAIFGGDDVPLALFRDDMQRLNVSSLSPMGLRVFQSYFLSINYRSKALRPSIERPAFLGGRRFRRNQEARALAQAVVSSEEGVELFEFVDRNAERLEGLEFLWRVAFESERADVGFTAASQVVHLYVRLTPRLKSRKARLQREFIQRCVETLVEACDEEGSSASTSAAIVRGRVRVARRASTMLKLFLRHFCQNESPHLVNLVVIPPSVGQPGSLARRNWSSVTAGVPFSIQVSESATLGEVKAMLADHINVSESSFVFRLVNNPCRVDGAMVAGSEAQIHRPDEQLGSDSAASADAADAALREHGVEKLFMEQLLVESSDYLSFSKQASASHQPREQPKWGYENPNVPDPFTSADMKRTVHDVGIQDWGILKIVDEKVEVKKKDAKGGGKASLVSQNQRQQMAKFAEPLISEALGLGYNASGGAPWLAQPDAAADEIAAHGEQPLEKVGHKLKYEGEWMDFIFERLLVLLDQVTLDDSSRPVAQDRVASKQIWDSMLLLPFYEDLVKQVEALADETHLEVLLPRSSVHRLLYVLRIIDSKILLPKVRISPIWAILLSQAPAEDPSPPHALLQQAWEKAQREAPPSSKQWMAHFVNKGGFDHLLEIMLAQQDSVQNGGRHVECFGLLVETVSELLLRDEVLQNQIFAFVVASFKPTSSVVASPTAAGGGAKRSREASVAAVAEDDAAPNAAWGEQTLEQPDSTSSTPTSSSTTEAASFSNVSTSAAPPGLSSPVQFPEDNAFKRFSAMVKNRARLRSSNLSSYAAGMLRPSPVDTSMGHDGDKLPSVRSPHTPQSAFSDYTGSLAMAMERHGSDVVACLLQAMLSASAPENSSKCSSEQLRTLVDHSLNLIMICICIGGPGAVADIAGFRGLRSWTEYLVIYNSEVETRRAACINILNMCRLIASCDESDPGFRRRQAFILDYLAILLPIVQTLHVNVRADLRGGLLTRKAHKKLSLCCEEFYELLCGLIKLVDRSNNAEKAKNAQQDGDSFFKSLFAKATEALRHHASLESFHSDRHDNLMIGLMKMIRSIVLKSPELKRGAIPNGLIEMLYHEFLFAPNYEADRLAEEASDPAPAAANGDDKRPALRPAGRAKGLLRRGYSGHSLIIQDQSAKCRTEASRNVALALLFELCEGCSENLLFLLEIVDEEGVGGFLRPAFSAQFKNEWNYNPFMFVKDPRSNTGLKNQGATCYMNSLLQQMFCIPSFCEAVLGLESTPDSVLHHLQVAFGSMRVSTKHFYDTLPLCKAIAKADGAPLNLSEQRDANEFATQLFDKIESESPAAKHVVESNFGGMLVNQIVSKDVNHPYVSERPEPFHILPVDVRGHTTLTKALDSFVKSELLNGDNQYRLDSGEFVDASKRTCIKSAPNHLIINLKRFEFDLRTLTKRKVNDRFEFPLTLDLEPYTLEYLSRTHAGEEAGASSGQSGGEDDQGGVGQGNDEGGPSSPRSKEGAYMYELAGVITHSGTMDSGHYFSLIRMRKPTFPPVGGEWFEFNDKLVWPYPIDCMPGDCFGGVDPILRADGTTVHLAKQKSAYMLVYDRKARDTRSKADNRGSMARLDFVRLSKSINSLPGLVDFDDLLQDDLEDQNRERKDSIEMSLDEYISEDIEMSRDGASSHRFSTQKAVDTAAESLEQQQQKQKPPPTSMWAQFVSSIGIDNSGAVLLRHFMFKDEPSLLLLELSQKDAIADAFEKGAENGSILRLPTHVVNAILRDNLIFIQHNYVFAVSNYKFVLNLCRIGDSATLEAPPEVLEHIRLLSVRCSVCFLVHVVARAWDILVDGILPSWREFLTARLSESSAACTWLLQAYVENDWLATCLQSCPKANVRDLLVELICCSVERVALTRGDSQMVDQLLSAFVEKWYVAGVDKSTRVPALAFVKVLQTYAQCGERERASLLQYDLAPRITLWYLEKSKGSDSTAKAASPPDALVPFVRLLLSLVQGSIEVKKSSSVDGPPIPLGHADVQVDGDGQGAQSPKQNQQPQVDPRSASAQAVQSIVEDTPFMDRLLSKDPENAETLFLLLSELSHKVHTALLSITVEKALQQSNHSKVSASVVHTLGLMRKLLDSSPNSGDSSAAKECADITFKPMIDRVVHIQNHQVQNGELFLYHCSKLLLTVAVQNTIFRETILHEWQQKQNGK